MTTMQTESAARALRRRLKGAVLEPGAQGWDAATQAYNLTCVQAPALTVVPSDAHDVIEVVDFARENGLQVAPQRTGHNAEPLGALDDVILLKTDALQGVEIDAERRSARVRSGAKWADVVPAASELGLAALHGSTPDVSVTGYALGGGVGWYARKLGLATNSVTAIELVTADGGFRRVDLENEAELFWALRGGGGSFGVVTALELELFAIPEVYAGVLFFPWERSDEVLHAWNAWTPTLPDEVTSVGRILQLPPLPEIPEPLRGGKFAVIEAVVIGDEAMGAELVAPLRALAPTVDTFATVPPVGIAELHMDPPGATSLRRLGADARLAARLARSTRSWRRRDRPPAPRSSRRRSGTSAGPCAAALRTTVRSRPSTPGSSRSGSGSPSTKRPTAAGRDRLDVVEQALAPYTNGKQYLNFTESHTDPARFYRDDAYRRLREVKAAVDPDEVFLSNHPIPPAS